MKINIKDKLIIIIGSAIVAFAICNIHSRFKISEGGQLGVELLLYNLFHISPSISSFVMDATFYLIGCLVIGKKFIFNAFIGTLSYSISYFIFEHLPFIIPDISGHLLLSAILGGILVGIGCGLVVSKEGACGGDDSLALVLNRITKLPIFACYFLMDVIIILLSLTYMSFNNIIYSLLTAFISSTFIGLIADYKKKES